MRLLVLDGAGLMVPDRAIVAVESADDQSDGAPPWLPALIRQGTASTPDKLSRVLRLANGGRVGVPADMRIVDGVEVLALPELLRPIGESAGIVGFAQLAEELLLVCDPNLLTGTTSEPAGAGGRSA